MLLSHTHHTRRRIPRDRWQGTRRHSALLTHAPQQDCCESPVPMPSQRRGSLRGSLRGSSFGESGSAAASSELKSGGGAAERGSARTAACGSGDSARPVGDACHQRAVPAAPAASASMPRIVPRGILSRREEKTVRPRRGLGLAATCKNRLRSARGVRRRITRSAAR